jgi:hypothetical protein
MAGCEDFNNTAPIGKIASNLDAITSVIDNVTDDIPDARLVFDEQDQSRQLWHIASSRLLFGG